MDDRTRLERKLQRNPAAILSADEVGFLVGEARRVLGAQFSSLFGAGSLQCEDVLRWGSLRARCEQVRAERRIDIKDAAVQARISRYRVVAIESGRLRELRPELAWRYFDFLGIRTWVKKWVRSNVDLATRAGIAASHFGRASSGGRKSNNAIQRTVPRVTALARERKVRATRPRR